MARRVKGGAWQRRVVSETAARKALNLNGISADDPVEAQVTESEMFLDYDTALRVAGIREIPSGIRRRARWKREW